MLNMRAAYEHQQAQAREPGSGAGGATVARGRQVINSIVKRFGLDPVYEEPDTFGPRMVIWLPAKAWNTLPAQDKKAVEAYMGSNYSSWGIGVGRVRGGDVLYDDLVVEH